MENTLHDLSNADLDGLRIIEKLGVGGMGEVWRGHHEDLDIPIALKVLKPEFAADQNFLVRFLREARAVAKLDHQHIVRVYDAGRRSWHGGNLRIMVMEFVEGQDASELLKAQRKGKLKPERAAEIVLAAAKALKYAHSKGVIHRDIKPANILCGKEGAIKVLDFGLAKLLGGRAPSPANSPVHSTGATGNDDSQSSTNAILGTPHYMPPEQAQGQPADGRADIYSLGITLYQLLTGVLPFDGDNAFSIISGHVREELPLKEELFGDLDPIFTELISGMCEKTPDDRIPLKLVIDRLEGFLGLHFETRGQSTATSVQSDKGSGDSQKPYGLPFETRAQGGATSGRTESRSPSDSQDQQPKTNLQKRKTSFVGRESELAGIRKLFENPDTSLVTVVGPGGVGKTRVTQEFGLSVVDKFEGGVYFCDLTESRTVDGIAAAVAQGLGIPLTQVDGVAQIAASLSMRKPLLLILDNFEQVVEHAGETLGRWMAKASQCKFLASSREPLHLEGEKSFPLAPLVQRDVAPDLRAGVLVDEGVDPPVQLFVDRAQDVKRGFTLDDSNRKAIEAIVDQLDGIPLAIELAASRCSALSPQMILERLPRRFDLLKGRRQDASARQATLRGAIDWSWELLKDYEQAALAQCSVFQGGFFLEAAEAVIDLSDYADAPFEMDVIESLVEKSLLVSFEVPSLPGENRYRMLESIRQYAAEKAMGYEDALEPLFLRHAKHYIDYAEHWNEETQGPNAVEALNRIELEYDNIFGIQEVLEGNRPELGARAILYASNALRIRGPWKERIPRLKRASKSLGDADDLALRIRISHVLTFANYDCGNKEGLESAALRTCELAAKLERDNPETQVLRLNAAQAQHLAYFRTGKLEDAGSAIDSVLDALGFQIEGLAEASRHLERTLRRAIATSIGNRGALHNKRGEYDQALACIAESEAISRELGYQSGVAANVGSRGNVHWSRGEFDQALVCYAEAAAINRGMGNQSGIAIWVGSCGSVHQDRGEFDQALVCYAEAEAIHREIGNQSGIAVWVYNRGNAHNIRGEFDQALVCYDEAEAINRELGNQFGAALCVSNRGSLLIEFGRFDEAWAALEEAGKIFRLNSNRSALAYNTLSQARVLLALNGDLEKALTLAQECHDFRRELGKETTKELFETLAVLSQVHLRLSRSPFETSAQGGDEKGSLPVETLNRVSPSLAGQSEEVDHSAKSCEHAQQAKALGEELEISRTYESPHPKAGEVIELWRWVEEALAGE